MLARCFLPSYLLALLFLGSPAAAAEEEPVEPEELLPAVPGEDGLPQAQTWRTTGWILAEQAAILAVDTFVAKPVMWDLPSKELFWQAFSMAPVVRDEDGPITNFIMHPLMGASFYMTARNHGHSVLMSTVMSASGSLLWEFGVESWYERPALSDLIITPALGVPIGMLQTLGKDLIRRNLPDRWPAHTLIFILDPVEGTDRLLFGGPPGTARW